MPSEPISYERARSTKPAPDRNAAAAAREAWALDRGACVLGNGAVRFSVWAPRVERVRLRLVTGEAAGEHALTRAAQAGCWSCTVAGARAGDEYVYLLGDDDQPTPDPVSRWLPRGVHGPSRVVDPAAFRWTDGAWRGVPMRDLALYEMHVGVFTPEGTFDGAIGRLREIAALGATAIEIMPVAQFPGERNWGYDGVGLYAVQNSYGGPDGLKRLVDAAHAHGLAVILDVVYNHLGPEGNYLDRFGPYHTRKYHTPWGPALNFDDTHSDDVRRYVVDNALHWVTEYHVDGLRLDAVHGIFDFSARHILQEIAESVHAQGARLGRTVVVIGESDLNDPRLLRRPEQHGYGLDAQWSDDFHHATHALLTGERAGYYADFGDVRHLARSLEEPFVYAGDYSAHRKRRHGAPSTGIPRERFVVAVQNHDQVGNRARGDRLAASLAPAQLRLAAALLLLSPYVPLIFMGEEYGETRPFQYFVSHSDERVVEAVREGRRAEFASFGWSDDIPDPQSEETFRGSMLDWEKPGKPAHAALLALYRDLLSQRRAESLLRPDGGTSLVEWGESGWISLLREGAWGSAPRRRASDANSVGAFLALFNCSAARMTVPVPRSAAGDWRLRLSTESPRYGGSADPTPRLSGETPGVELPAWSAALYARAPRGDG